MAKILTGGTSLRRCLPHVIDVLGLVLIASFLVYLTYVVGGGTYSRIGMGTLSARTNPLLVIEVTVLLAMGTTGAVLILQGMAAWLAQPSGHASPAPRRAIIGGLLFGMPLWVLGAWLYFDDEDKWIFMRPVQNGMGDLSYAAIQYYVAPHTDASGARFTHRFPRPMDWTPPDRACDYFRDRYPPRPELWTTPTWRALKLKVDEPSRAQYRFEVPDPRTAIIRVRLDQDCDGKYATWSRTFGPGPPAHAYHFRRARPRREPACFTVAGGRHSGCSPGCYGRLRSRAAARGARGLRQAAALVHRNRRGIVQRTRAPILATGVERGGCSSLSPHESPRRFRWRIGFAGLDSGRGQRLRDRDGATPGSDPGTVEGP